MEPADAGTVDMADAAGGQGEPAEDFDDPFAPRGAGSPTAAVPQPSEPLDDGDFVPPVESDALVAGHETDAMPLEPSDPPASVRPRAAAPRGRPAPLGQPRDDGFGFEDLPRPKPRPSAPPVESDPFSGAPPATVASPAPRAAVAPRGGIPPASPRPTAVPMAIVGGVPGRNDPRPTVYEVQPNDNFWRISSKQYGTAKYYMALARVNVDRIPDPTKLRPGMKVLTPTPETLEARFPDLFPNRAAAAVAEGQAGFHYGPDGRPMYRIGESDTLGTIARDHLGRTSRWIQIYEMNRDRVKSPQELQVGAVLKLPLDASAVRVVQNPPMIR